MRRPAQNPQVAQRTRIINNGVQDSDGRGTPRQPLTQISIGSERYNLRGDTLVDEWGRPIDINTVPDEVLAELRKRNV
jgi:hypothetical protein